MSSTENEKNDLGKRVFISASWLVAGKWGSRFLGIISTIILARILYPDDYGVVAKGMLLVSFVEIVTVLDGERYLIAKRDADDEDFNTAWTLRLIQCFIIAIVLYVLSDVFSVFFNEDRLVEVIQVFSIAVFFTGFQNIGLEKYNKNLEFSKIFVFSISQKLIAFVVTIVLAFILENYWAMVYGTVAFRVAGVLLSYVMHPFRPRLSLIKVKAQWSFTKWMLINNIASFMKNKLDVLIVSKSFDSSATGVFSMGHQIANMPINQLIAPIYQALYSGYAKLSHDYAALAKAHLNALGAVCVIILPITFFLYMLCHDFVILLLGERWEGTVEIIRILILATCALGINGLSTNVLISLQLVKNSAVIDWVYVMLLVPTLIYAESFDSLVYITWGRLLVTLFIMPFYLSIVQKELPISWIDSLSAIWKPLLSSLVMVVVLWVWQSNAEIARPEWVPFILKAVVASLIYFFILYGLWSVSGKGNTGEKILFDKFSKVIKR